MRKIRAGLTLQLRRGPPHLQEAGREAFILKKAVGHGLKTMNLRTEAISADFTDKDNIIDEIGSITQINQWPPEDY